MDEMHEGNVATAIEAGKQIASVGQKPVDLGNGRMALLLPNGMTQWAIDPLTAPLPGNVIQSETLIDQASFCEYVDRFSTSETVIFANPEGKMTAVIDYHHRRTGTELAQPDHCKHVAVFKTAFDPNYERWRDIDRKMISQQDFAYFVEEMLHTICSPDGADLLEMAQTLKVIRGVTFSQNVRIKDGTADIQYKEDDTTHGNSGIVSVPDEIMIVCPVFLNRPQQTIKAKLRYRIAPDNPLSFRIDILNRTLIELEAFKVMCDEVAEKTTCPVLLSTR